MSNEHKDKVLIYGNDLVRVVGEQKDRIVSISLTDGSVKVIFKIEKFEVAPDLMMKLISDERVRARMAYSLCNSCTVESAKMMKVSERTMRRYINDFDLKKIDTRNGANRQS